MTEQQEPKYTTNEAGRLVNRVSGEEIPDDEPVFIFRARDLYASEAIRWYAAQCRDRQHQTAVLKRVDDFWQFRSRHPGRMKEPDTEPAKS